MPIHTLAGDGLIFKVAQRRDVQVQLVAERNSKMARIRAGQELSVNTTWIQMGGWSLESFRRSQLAVEYTLLAADRRQTRNQSFQLAVRYGDRFIDGVYRNRRIRRSFCFGEPVWQAAKTAVCAKLRASFCRSCQNDLNSPDQFLGTPIAFIQYTHLAIANL